MSKILDIARKYVRFPWEVWDGHEHFKDREIANDLVHGCNAGDYFKSPPPKELYTPLLSAIIRSLTITWATQTGRNLDERNTFKTLSEEDQQYMLNTYFIQPQHRHILEIRQNDYEIPLYASYYAASYALTTHCKAFVCDFPLLHAVAQQSLVDTPREEEAMRRAGLLVITGLDQPCRSDEWTYAYLARMVSYRSLKNRMNIFIHTPIPELTSCYTMGRLPSRLDVVNAYVRYFPPSYVIASNLIGSTTHFADAEIAEHVAKQQK